MKDFRTYEIYDFLVDPDFIRWVKQGQEADALFWNNWLKTNPYKHLLIEEARQILQSVVISRPVTEEWEAQLETDKLLSAIHVGSEAETEEDETTFYIKKKKRHYWWVVAAVILIVSISGYYFSGFRQGQPTADYRYTAITSKKQLVENVNTTSQPITIHLADGSKVSLMPNSSIAYENNLESGIYRDIYLSGEAFFSVNRNPNRPFRVFANEIVTKVLGTSFTIRSFEKDNSIKVIVKTGKVSVYSQVKESVDKEVETQKAPDEMLLTPNQELVYQKNSKAFKKLLLDRPEMVVPEEVDETLSYTEEPLATVFTQLQYNYGVNIVYDEDMIKHCTISADLRNVAFYEKLDLLCKAIGARYEMIEGQIVIYTKGCD